jgi:hypothetical protein
MYIVKNTAQKTLIASFLLSLCTFSGIEANQNMGAYGAQGSMSPPNTTSLILDGMSRNQGGSNNSLGNGVYLSAQPPITFSGMSSAALAPLGSPIGPSMSSGPSMPQAPAYGSPLNYQSGPSLGYGNSYPQGYGQPSFAQPSYNQPNFNPPGFVPQPVNPYAIPYQTGTRSFGPSSYMTSSPTYGNAPDLLQRNSANYYSADLPYRKSSNSQMTFNPDARNPNSPTLNRGPQPNQQVVDILSAQKPQEEKPKVASTTWFQKMATKAKEPRPPRW